MIAALRNRNFAFLWLGGLISLAGDWVLMVGLPIYVYLLTRSVLLTSFMLLASAVPNVLLGSLAGVFVDRWNRKRTLVVANLLMTLGLLPLLLVHTADRVWIVYAVAVFEASVEQFSTPAQNALLPSLVGEERLVSANSLNSLSSNLARLVGPGIGGAIAGFFGLNGIVAADALSFLLAGALCVLIAAPWVASRVAGGRAGSPVIRVLREWRDGLRVIHSDRTLIVLLGMFAVTALGEGVFGVLYPIFVYRVLHGGALQIGELMSAQAVGGLLGGLLAGLAGKRVMSRWVIGFGLVAFGLIDLAIFNSPAFFPVYWLTVGLFVAVGIPGVASGTGAQSLLQARAPGAYLGRVFGALGTTMGLMLLLGTITAGVVTDHLGVVPVLNIQGAGYVAGGALLLVMLRGARQAPVPAALTADEPTLEESAARS